MKINVLGTEYSVIIDESPYLENINADGVHKEYEKTITKRSLNGFLGQDSTQTEKEARKKEVLRHEIIHAFFSGSGLDDYNTNEQLVNWLAIQFPKIQKAFEEANCL